MKSKDRYFIGVCAGMPFGLVGIAIGTFFRGFSKNIKVGDFVARKPRTSNGVNGKSVSKEMSIYRTLKEMIGTDTKVYYIMYLYCPEYLKDADREPIKNFADLKNRYETFSDTITEDVCKKYLLEQGCQTAVKWLLKRLHQKKQIELYNTYYEKALGGDVQAFKAFQEFSDKFFKEDKEGELTRLLNKIPDGDLEDDKEDYSYTYEE